MVLVKQDQVELIRKYHDFTPWYEVPAWVYALRFAGTPKIYVMEQFFAWDYGLTMDCQLLMRHRLDGRLPFVPNYALWKKLEERREHLKNMIADGR